MKKILVVGAGFAGSVIARELAEKGGFQVDVIDSRDHVGGNAYDLIHPNTGGRYHKYGPHIFHTNDQRVFSYLSRFTGWIPYEHRVEVSVEGIGDVPIPININTINAIYDKNISSEAELNEFFEEVRVCIDSPKNAREYLLNLYGEKITELFFSRYTKKMWGVELEDTPISTVARIPVRGDFNANYFNDTYQVMPDKGYENLFLNLLDHEFIRVSLGKSFSKEMEVGYWHTFNSMPIDVYFDQCFGELPYRSIKFEHRFGEKFFHKVPTVNFSDFSRYTRKTGWLLYPGCGSGHLEHVTYEIPCDYRDNDFERYYPVRTPDGWPQNLYKKYESLAKELSRMTFIGRCGKYIYYDMHQVVAQSLKISCDFLRSDKDK